jgi:microcystin degradation protein MlrC
MANLNATEVMEKAHGVLSIELYKGYQLIDREDFVAICYAGGVVASAHTPEQARSTVDELIEQRKAALMKKMGRHDNNPNDLI